MKNSRSYSVRRAVTPSDRDAIFRLRYLVYVEEMHRSQRYADHERKLITDPLDATAVLLGLWDDDACIGTVRSNKLRDSYVGEYCDLYGLGELSPADVAVTSITTRFMIARPYRHTRLTLRLVVANYDIGIDEGIAYDFMDCNHHRTRTFEKLGYKIHRPSVQHPEYGDVAVMRLALLDIDHLNTVASPFIQGRAGFTTAECRSTANL